MADTPVTISSPEAARTLTFLLVRVIRGVRRDRPSPPPELAAILHGSGFSGRHLVLLMHLAEAGSLTVGDLSRRLDVSMSSSSILVQQLTAAGLVERSEDPADRRRAIIRIAPAYAHWIQSTLAERTAPLVRTMDRLDAAERAALIKGLRIMAEEIEHGHGDTVPDRE